MFISEWYQLWCQLSSALCFTGLHYICHLEQRLKLPQGCFIYLFTTLFNVGHTVVTRLIKINLTKTNTDIMDENFKIFDMQHLIFCTWFNFCLYSLTETLCLTDVGRLFQSNLPWNCTEFVPYWDDRAGGKMFPFLKL